MSSTKKRSLDTPKGKRRKEASRGERSLPRSEALPGDRYVVLAVCGLLLLAVVLVFGQTSRFQFVFDDTMYVSENPTVQNGLTWSGLVWAFTSFEAWNWHPLTWLSHMLDFQCYGLWPGGHHLTSVLLHMVSVIVWFLVLRQMTGRLWPSALVAALFAIHPLHVESVAWISERKDVLSGLFFGLTLAAYLGHVRRPFSVPRYLLVVLAFALGLLSKPMLVTLPCVLLLLDYWPLRRWDPLSTAAGAAEGSSAPAFPSRVLLEKVPLLLLAAASCLVTMSAQTTAMARVPWTARAANALVSYVAYLGQSLWPVDLAAYYPHRQGSEPVWAVAGALLLLAGVSIAVVVWRRRHPYLLVGWLWYLGMLVPVIGLIQVGDQARADRYMYLPLIGLSLALAWLTAEFVGTSLVRWRRCALAWLLALAILTGLAWQQTSYWQDSETLWSHCLASTTDNWMASYNLGLALSDRGQFDAAMIHYRKTLELKPGWTDAHNNLGAALLRLGRFQEAIAEYEKMLEIKPRYAEAHNNIGACLLQQGQTDAAIAQFQKALELKPGYADALQNLAIARAMRK